jgi:[protein-PII] uridylyltransferase
MPEVQSDLPAPSSAQTPHERWKLRLAGQRAILRERFLENQSAAELLRRHCRLIDQQLQAVWRHFEIPPDVALVAVGGYGRGQLFPFSDIDLLILLPGPASEALGEKLEQFVGALWDIGLEIGHSVRTTSECLEFAAQDITVQTSLLEARQLAGPRTLFGQFKKQFKRAINAQDFAKAKRLEQEQRHARFHDTNLEPNVKEVAGGLRDLHNILWISKAADIGASWTALVKADVILRREAALLRKHKNFLQNLRIHLHYVAGRREERLVFDVQNALAAQMGFRASAHHRASEHLMQRFYRTALEISQINTIVLQNMNALISPQRERAAKPLNERFVVRNERLEAIDESLFRRQPSAILESFNLLQQNPQLKGMTAQTLRAMWRAGDQINPVYRRDPVNREMFLRILRSPERVIRELRRMNQYGVLGRYIPAFGRIVGQMQHDLFHVYTVDQHIMMVLRNMRRFFVPEHAHEYPLCSQLALQWDRPHVLFLAALFHDVAKGRGGDHSDLGAIEVRRFCREHGVDREDAQLIEFLVKAHLTMSRVAQKEDLSDPTVVRGFARLVGSERRLSALYLLTVADIRGTSPKVWNAWKGKLLEDLYKATLRSLGGAQPHLDAEIESRKQDARNMLSLALQDRGVEAPLWSTLEISYFARHDAADIAWHARALHAHLQAESPVVVARVSPIGEGLQVLVYARDQADLFARICGYFDSAHFNILDAKVHTTRAGFALDTFQVINPSLESNVDGNSASRYRDLILLVETQLGKALSSSEPLPEPSRGRLSRRVKSFPVTPRVTLRPDERAQHWLLGVSASDRSGLLYSIARVLARHQINLQFAKVMTLGERVEDTFLIDGAALRHNRTQIAIETELLDAIAA